MNASSDTVHVVCATLNGAAYVGELIESIRAQTHANWQLWVRDDGSGDDTVTIVRRAAAADARVRLVHVGGSPTGAARAFNWLLAQLPSDAAYVMCADQDDIWHTHKIATTLRAMRAAEAELPTGTPVLAHTDLTVVDAQLREIHHSFWEFARIDSAATSLRRTVVQNVVTGATAMLNRPLRELVGVAPADVMYHDWWYAMVAAAFGRIVPVFESTMSYRQHGANTVGARDARRTLRALPAAVVSSFGNTRAFRQGLRGSAVQARAFLDRYGAVLPESDRRFLSGYSRIPDQSFLRRKLGLLRFRVLPNRGLWHIVGVLVRG